MRIADASEAPAITALINRAFLVEKFFVEGDRISLDEVRGLFGKGEFLVAEEDGVLAGCVYLEPRGERSYLGLLSTEPTRQRSGLGSRLVAAAEARARELGCRHVDLSIVNLRQELPPFYRRLGYAENGTAPFPAHAATKLPCHFIKMDKAL